MPRFQAAILRDNHILLIQHREHAGGRAYWLLPGGGMEPGETEVECVRREIHEETNLDVQVERLILEEILIEADGVTHKTYKTFLCCPLSGNAAPGYEPEPWVSAKYEIAAVGWFDLYDESNWNPLILNDRITAPLLRRIRAILEVN